MDSWDFPELWLLSTKAGVKVAVVFIGAGSLNKIWAKMMHEAWYLTHFCSNGYLTLENNHFYETQSLLQFHLKNFINDDGHMMPAIDMENYCGALTEKFCPKMFCLLSNCCIKYKWKFDLNTDSGQMRKMMKLMHNQLEFFRVRSTNKNGKTF